MPPVPVHLKTSLSRTGKDYKEVHEWIDDPDMEIKAQRHDITKIHEFGTMIAEKYGAEGLQEYIMHLHDDIKMKFSHILHDYEKAMANAMTYFGIKEGK